MPWQTGDQDQQADAESVNAVESLALERHVRDSDLSADASKCAPSTDAGLTRSERSLRMAVAALPDDRLFTLAEISMLLKVRKSDVYAACDRGDLEYVKFQGAVQVEGRDLKRWVLRRSQD